MTDSQEIIALLGGSSVISTEITEELDLVRLVRRGLPVGVVDQLLQADVLTTGELDRLVLPRKTLAHRRRKGVLTASQSDRIVRVARVFTSAEETLGSQAKAHAWLRRPNKALRGEAPLNLLDTEEGTRQVEQLLGRITHGIAA